MYLFLIRQVMESGSHTPRGWWPILKSQSSGNSQNQENAMKIPGGNLPGLLRRLNRRFRPSYKKPKCKKKLKLKGRKRRFTTSKHAETSSTESSEYSTNSSVFSSDDEGGWSDKAPLTPSQEMNWTQFITKLCNKDRSPVDPVLSPNKQ